MSPIHCIRFILFPVSYDLSALLFLCGRYQKNAKFEGWADHVTGKASEGFRAWCNEYILRLVTWSTHWICATFGHYVIDFSVKCMNRYILFISHTASLDHWIVQSRQCMLRLKFHWPTFMTQQYVGTKFIFVSLSVSQPCTPYIHNTKTNLKRKSFHSKTQNKMPTVCDKTGAEEI